MKSRLLAALSYLGVLCLVPMLVESKESFVVFHARQGLVLWVWTVLSYFAMHLPGLGPYIFSTSTVLVLFLSMFGLFSVVMNQRWRIPVIATLAGLPDETTHQRA
ncbi:MAG: hypothetical protein HQL97_17440 [Magnetococcales bacterium]|nr:hypothetical protein [Magnetococcales bacterium]MBF0263612.1 hypothetical protein [Magnetococcales bacterium]